MSASLPDHDVIIVGGRPAGASLAARLGAAGLRVLILEKATFPSAPAVSCPIFFSSGMRLLDEIGLDESAYVPGHARLPGVVLEFRDVFRTFVRMPEAHGRAYLHGLDRRTFDAALWDHLERHPTVERREGFHVTDVVRDERGRVIGVRGHRPGQAEETLRGRCVVGADGRFSVVARKVSAKTTEERTDRGTTVYYAYWKGLETYGGAEDWVHVHTGIDGFSAFITPAAPGEWGVMVQCRKDYFRADEGVERWYDATLRRYPAVWRRFARATRITELSGMKDVGNLYREAGGDGWALVGDAYHQKDSYDGQGIYDALAGAKILAEALVSWHAGEASWEEALGRYRAKVHAESHPMFRHTMERLDRELYGEPPPLVTKTLLRWMLTDPEYTARLGALVTRSVHPDVWMNGATMLRTLSRGLAGDLRRIVERRADPSAMPVFDLPSDRGPGG